MSDWEFYGKDKIIIGTTIFTLEELQNAVENKFERDKSKIEDLNKLNEFIGKELETYKKIAEKLAEIVISNHQTLEYHHLDEDYKFYRSDKEDVIDWAKSEVLKNENGNDKTSN